MDKNLEVIFEASDDSVICVENGIIIYVNAAAIAAFDKDMSGLLAEGVLPAQIIMPGTSSYVTSVEISGEPYSATCSDIGETRVIYLVPQYRPGEHGAAALDSVVNSMRSSLFNMRLSVEQYMKGVSAGTEADPEVYTSVFYHNYYTMLKTVNNLNAFDNIISGKLTCDLETENVTQLCQQITHSVNHYFKHKDITITFSTPDAELYAEVDKHRIEQMLLSILANSIENVDEDGHIGISLRNMDNSFIISVDDDGRGIPPHILVDVFKSPGTRFTKLKKGEISPGLGLFVAKGIAERHGGTMVIESREGKGTAVRIMIPKNLESTAKFKTFRTQYHQSDTDTILTALSAVLGSEFYTKEYLD